MELDIFVYYLRLPVLLICILLSIIFFSVGKPWQPLPQTFNRLGIRRIALGMGGSALATGLLAISESDSSISGLGYIGTIFIPVMLVIAMISVPLLSLLARYGWASLFSILLLTSVIAVLWGGFTYMYPHNAWCTANQWKCAGNAALYSILFLGTIGLGFGLLAQLPLWRNL